MANKKLITLGRLRAALERLINGCPIRVKKSGRITLNKINNEAGLGNAYINHFNEFVTDEATPKMNEYNNKLCNASEQVDALKPDADDEINKLKSELKKEKKLKSDYRKSRDDAITAKKHLEEINNSLMFRLYELQEELRMKNVLSLTNLKRS
jgi:hypothetical protein